MILIADSGSTKTDWVLLASPSKIEFETAGFNPHVVDSIFIEKELKMHTKLLKIAGQVSQIYFYGAGCSSNYLSGIVRAGISTVFTKAKIEIYHDLLGSARSTWNGNSALTCILGTGSNCCFYDGNTVQQSKPSLGYLLGDEGSGKDLGAKLLKAVLYKDAPVSVSESFMRELNPNNEDLVTVLYSQNRPNRYLASYASFIHKHKSEGFIQGLILESFKSFRDVHIKSYPQWRDIPCHFIGSIAFYFQAELAAVLKEDEIKLGRVLQKPIDGLVMYHQETASRS